MSLIPFESSWKKSAEREKLREARETILAAAEAKAEKLAKWVDLKVLLVYKLAKHIFKALFLNRDSRAIFEVLKPVFSFTKWVFKLCFISLLRAVGL